MIREHIVHEILGTEFTEMIGSDWTFAGVLIEYWAEISKSWTADTTRKT